MNRCDNHEIRDLLPDFVHNQLDATSFANVRAHVAGCAECASEVELLKAVVASAPAAPDIDVAAVVAALPRPTRHGFLVHRGNGVSAEQPLATIPPSVKRRSFWSRSDVRIAASLAVVAGGALTLALGRDVLRPDTPVGATRVATAPQSAAQLTPAAEIAPAPAAVPAAPTSTKVTEASPQVASTSGVGLALTGDLKELSDENLATLLDDLNSMDGIPSEEPDVLEPTVNNGNPSGGNQ